MPTNTQGPHQRASDQAGPTRHQHLQPATVLARAWRSGSIASVLSTLVVSCFSRRRVGSAASGTNAASQWVWYPQARFAHGPSWRHTATGYLIHHASSVFWACAYHATKPECATPTGRSARAAGVAALAYYVDYHVVPRRLSPGFEHKIGRAGMWAVYGAFAVGLLAGTRVVRARSAARRAAAGVRDRN